MEIKWLGHSAFEIKSKTATIITDPYEDSIGLKWQKRNADIMLVSHEHYDHNNQAGVEANFTAEGPGEYEVKEIAITGIRTYHDANKGEERGVNTVYAFTVENVTICHLGDLGHKLTGEQVEELPDVDVLLVPVGGKFTIDGATAAEVVNQLEPKVVIPMHYQIPGLTLSQELDGLEQFMKALGLEAGEKQLSFKVGAKDSLPADMKVVILEPQK